MISNDTLELWLVRHGETDWNASGRAQGHEDIPLNASGIQQAQRLAARLAGQHFDAVVASDLSRALETARAVAARLAGTPPVQLDSRWREQHLGVIQGLTHADTVARGWTYPQTPPEAWDGAESKARERSLATTASKCCPACECFDPQARLPNHIVAHSVCASSQANAARVGATFAWHILEGAT